jgi:cytoskeletal protein CcmA (bactofilin family)
MIPQGVTITGNIDGTSNLRIDGTVRGDVKLMGRLEVGEGGLIEGNLHAEDVVVVGKVNGNIKSRNKLLLKSGSHVRGNLSCEGLIVEEGAWFSGRCSMGKDSQQSIDSAPAPSPIGRLTQVPAGARDRESVASRLHGQATTTNTISSIDSDERKIASEG